MDSSPWRLAAGAGAGVVAVVALVAWRSADLAGGWLWALRIAALVAVLGLLVVVLLAGRQALAPRARHEVVVQVPAAGAGAARVVPPSAGADLAVLRGLLLTAVLVAAPVLVVLVLAVPASGRLAVAGGQVDTPPAAPSTAPAAPSTAPAAPSTAPAAPSTAPAAPSTAPAAPSTAPAAPSTAPAAPSTAPAAPSTAPAAPSTAARPCQHVVSAGQTLWGIAAAQLGPAASDAQIDRRWRAVYAANAAAVGGDPDLIRPGLVLVTCT